MGTKKQHFIPVFYLKNFCDSNGFLNVYNCKSATYYLIKPDNICYNKFLYETEWAYPHESSDDELKKYILFNNIEKHFAERERVFSKTLRKIIGVCCHSENKDALVCSSDDKEILSEFAVNLFLRNPLTMKNARIDEIPQKFYDLDIYQETSQIMNLFQIGDADSLVRSAIKKNWLDGSMRGSVPDRTKQELDKLSYSFWVSKGSHFILSNFPVVYQIDSQDRLKLFILPLSPACMVVFCEKKFINRNRIYYVDDYTVGKINGMILENLDDISGIIMAQNRHDIEIVLKKEGKLNEQT